MKQIVFVLLCVFVAFTVQETPALQSEIPDYEWRFYTGKVPRSALQVNPSDCVDPIYIGIGWFAEGLLPGNLRPNNTEIVVTATQKLLKPTKNPLILVTHHPLLYSWVATTTQTFEELRTRCELVIGGVETNHTMYIGRQVQDGKLLVGKIYKYPSRELVLPANNPKNEIRYTKFEALAYNCQQRCSV